MASFTYSRSFTHIPWRNQKDVVDAEGENGFNRRFHDLEAEFDTIGTTVADIGQEVDRLESGLSISRRQQPLTLLTRNVPASGVTDPEPIDTYSNADFPENRPRLYSVRIGPLVSAPHAQVSHHFIYLPAGDQTTVQIWFKNERDTATAVIAQIFALA